MCVDVGVDFEDYKSLGPSFSLWLKVWPCSLCFVYASVLPALHYECPLHFCHITMLVNLSHVSWLKKGNH